MMEALKTRINQIEDELIAFRRQIHSNPELSMEEYETSSFIKETLEQHGIEAEYIWEKLGVTALIQGGYPGEAIALRADIDALPVKEQTGLSFASKKENVMHACGHDIHATVLMGTAIVLNENRHKLKGSIRLIFQISEEKLLGSLKAIEAGLLENPKVKCIAAFHCWPELPAGTIGVKSGPFMAGSDELNIKVFGKGGHAAHPHRAIDPIIAMSYILTTLQTVVSREIAPVDSAVLTIGRILGGTAGNIIPPMVECWGTVRTLTNEVRDEMEERIERIASHTAQALGCRCEIDYKKQCPPVINDDSLMEEFEKSLETSIGKENIYQLGKPSMGGEDFAFYLEKVPGFLVRLGTNNDMPESRNGLHNPSIIFDEKSIVTGVTAMSCFVFDLLKKD
jgi:amidohydrolase